MECGDRVLPRPAALVDKRVEDITKRSTLFARAIEAGAERIPWQVDENSLDLERDGAAHGVRLRPHPTE